MGFDTGGSGSVDGEDISPASVSTDNAVINNAPTSSGDALRFDEGVEAGTTQITGSDRTAADGTWDTWSITSASVTFNSAFASTPVVVVTTNGDQSSTFGFDVSCSNISTTGFDLNFVEYHSLDLSGDNLGSSYIATEGR